MSTPERTDDSGEHGYGAAKQEPGEKPDAEAEAEIDDDGTEAEANPSRREREAE